MSYKDTLGDKLKIQEQAEAGRKADPHLPLMARIDGKCFSKFTKGLKRPFDPDFSALMVDTTKYLVEKSEALLGYCQSDEITLYWYLDKNNHSNREFWFNGKYQKLTSVLAATASSFFAANLDSYLPDKAGEYPVFDARVWNVPDLEHVYLNFLWRLQDATKNSVSMLAHHHFSHKSLQGATCNEMKLRLASIGENWENYPRRFTHGTYMKRQQVLVSPGSEALEKIPVQYRPTEPVTRTFVREWIPSGDNISLSDFTTWSNDELSRM